jgi:glycosyltransferase involved in cell wall biosynthesis
MRKKNRKTQILYSFPWSIGASGIGYTAWEHVNELSKLNTKIHLYVGHHKKKFDTKIHVTKLSQCIFNKKVPTIVFGSLDNAAKIHDFLVTQYIRKHHKSIDVLHCWPLASLTSIKTAKSFGIKTFLERPNTHSEYAYSINEKIYAELNLKQERSSSHRFNNKRLEREQQEYFSTDFLLCPSDFVVSTFLERDFSKNKLLRNNYGFSPERIKTNSKKKYEPFLIVFVGNDALRKGLITIIKAWNQSDACIDGELHIYGKINKKFITRIVNIKNESNIIFHEFTNNVSDIYSKASCLVLSSYEEGSALVTYEARASGCVLLVSNATGAVVKHNKSGLVHKAGDHDTLTKHINLIYNDHNIFLKLQKHSLSEVHELTWEHSAYSLLNLYKQCS